MWNLIFDYDGTLHNCIRIYAPAFHGLRIGIDPDSGFVRNGNGPGKRSAVGWGFLPAICGITFAPGLPEEQKQFCSTMIGRRCA
ncbi:MAG: hypothetical protein ACLU48_02070 [Clostridiaceae bacterium]